MARAWVLTSVLVILAKLPIIEAGEVVIYQESNCQPSAIGGRKFPTINSVPCAKAELSIGSPIIYSVSTGRNIGPVCDFRFYTDDKCSKLIQSVDSSGPEKRCLPIKAGLRSYEIKCSQHSSNKPLSYPKEEPTNLEDAGGGLYFQPRTTYRGKSSAHTNINAYLPVHGGQKSKPSGSAAIAGFKLASAYAKQVPKHASKFKASASDGGTTYTVEVTPTKGNGYNAEKVIAVMGQAAFASMMADTIASLLKAPATYLSYGVANEDVEGEEIAYVNVTYH